MEKIKANFEIKKPQTEQLKMIGDGYREVLNSFILKDYSYSPYNESAEISSIRKKVEQLNFEDKENLTGVDEYLAQLDGIESKNSGQLLGYQKQGLIDMDTDFRFPVVKIDTSIFESCTGRKPSRTQAIAFRGKHPFVVIRTYKDRTDSSRLVETNIPHELHHVLWKEIRDNKFFSLEDSEESKHFDMYRDEVIARVAGDESPNGYNLFQLTGLDSDVVQEYKKKNLNFFEEIQDKTIGLNEELRNLTRKLNERGIPHSLILGIFLKSKSFNEATFMLKEIEDEISKISVLSKKSNTDNPWGIL
jgi:hypothetical protein